MTGEIEMVNRGLVETDCKSRVVASSFLAVSRLSSSGGPMVPHRVVSPRGGQLDVVVNSTDSHPRGELSCERSR